MLLPRKRETVIIVNTSGIFLFVSMSDREENVDGRSKGNANSKKTKEEKKAMMKETEREM